MTKEQIKELLKTEDLEDTLCAIQELIQEDLADYISKPNPHPQVVACLNSAIESCANASFCWYASFK